MLSLIIASFISCSNPDIAELKLYAPETLQPPVVQEFVSYDYYLRAKTMYSVCGHWST